MDLVGRMSRRSYDETTEDKVNDCGFLCKILLLSAQILIAMWTKWCKQRMQLLHWHEEMDLVVEEMQQTITYFKWKVQWWEEQGSQQCDGITATVSHIYSLQHASEACDVNCELCSLAMCVWYSSLQFTQLGHNALGYVQFDVQLYRY